MSLNKRKAINQLEQARLHLDRGEWAEVERLVRPVADAGFTEAAVFSLLGEALRQLGRRDEAKAVLLEGLAKHPGAGELDARLGCVLLDLEDVSGAIERLGRARQRLPRDPQVFTSFAAALLRAGRAEEAEAQLARALLLGAGPDARLVLAGVKVRRGRFDEADRLAAQVEALEVDALLWPARAIRADIRLLRGDALGALEAWQRIDEAGRLEPWQLSNLAWAAELAAKPQLADAAIARRDTQQPGADELLLFAQIANLRRDFEHALRLLERAKVTVRAPEPAWHFEFLSARGRALRLAGQLDEARTALEEAVAMAEAELPRLGAPPFVDLGHLAAERGDFEAAEARFRRALELDPTDPEATRALDLTRRRLGWKEAVTTSAEERVAQAQAEAEAVRRRYVVRESEVEELKREVERLRVERSRAEKEASKLTAEAEAERKKLEAAGRARLQAELEQQTLDVDAKALENLESVFGTRRDACPERIWKALLVAERTFQQSLYTELPAAAVAVLFSGAFERALVDLLAQGFDAWLDKSGSRLRFLEDGVRERRGGRVEYLDRFFDWFDREQNARPPALGEISRVLDRRHDRHLAPFATFLTQSFELDQAFWDEFTRFVSWGKETLRDPVAHGHIDLDWTGLKRFREQLLFEFSGTKPGALPRLLAARKK